ncbi:MAG TPA: hypothetical protein VLE20_03210 [Blastocatellia bacterium]|nr:hypothetical protein [Blastocatellia bacterium]
MTRTAKKSLMRFGRMLRGLAIAGIMAGCSPQVSAQTIVDQILALVNEDVITRTDLLWSIALDPKAPSPAGDISSDLLKQKLEVMVDLRLVSQEAARVPSVEVNQEEVDKKRTEVIRSFKSEAEFRQRVESVGLTPDRIDDLIRERIAIDRFVDFRFRSFVLVTEPEIQKYYDETLAPRVRAGGQVPPPLEKVSEEIGALLKQEKINTEIDRWLNTARQRADVVQLAEP